MAHDVTLVRAVQAGFELDSINVDFTVSDADSKVFVIVQADAVVGVPDAAAIIAGLDGDGGGAAAASDTGGLLPVGAVGGLTLTGIKAAGLYDVYAVATDGADANAGTVGSVIGVSMTVNDSLAGGASDFPDNPNDPAPDGTASTLPDDGNYTLNPYADPAYLTQGPDVTFDATVPSITVTQTLVGETHDLYAGAYPVGSTPPTVAELKAGTGAAAAGSALATADGVQGSVALTTGLVTTEMYDVYAVTETVTNGESDLVFLGSLSMLDSTDAPYISVAEEDYVTAYNPTSVLNAGAFKDPNSAIPVVPATNLNEPTSLAT